MARFSSDLEVRPQQLGFLLVQLQNRGGRLEGDEVLVAVQQASACWRWRRRGSGCLKQSSSCCAGFLLLAQAHQVDAELRARAPQIRLELESLAVEANAFVVAAVDDEEVRRRSRRPRRSAD